MVRRSDTFLRRARWFFLVVLVFSLYLSWLVVKPLLNALILGGVAAYVLFPLFKSLNKKYKKRNASAFICSLLGMFLIFVPLILLANTLAVEIGELYGDSKRAILNEDFFLLGCPKDTSSLVCTTTGVVNQALENPEVKATMGGILRELVSKITGAIQELVLALPRFIVFMFVTVFSMFYLVRDGALIVSQVKQALPIEKHHTNLIFSQLHNTLRAVVWGTLAIAGVQAVLAMLGFWMFGLSRPVFWGVVLAFFAFIPFIGSWIVWLPAGIIVILKGNAQAVPLMMWKGVALLVYGLIVISGIENVLRPILLGNAGKIPTLIVVLGVVGGVMVFGPIGFVIGPIILSLFKTFFDIYRKERTLHEV